jgi:hypothetical protein
VHACDGKVVVGKGGNDGGGKHVHCRQHCRIGQVCAGQLHWTINEGGCCAGQPCFTDGEVGLVRDARVPSTEVRAHSVPD